MNLQLENMSISASNILGIFDLDAITVEKTTRDTLNRAQTNDLLYDFCNGELPRSLVLVDADDSDCEYYLAAPNTSTLHKRMKKFTANGSR